MNLAWNERHHPLVAVIGANGWIGQSILHELDRRGHRILAISRRPPEQLPLRGAWRELTAPLDSPEFAESLAAAMAIINVAGAAHLSSSHKTQDATFANEKLPGLVGRVTARAGVRRLVHLSSIKALGEGGSTPLKATDVPEPSTTYGKSKLVGERSVRQAVAGTKVRLAIVRSPMVYGPRAPANFARLAHLALSPAPLPLPAPHPRRSLIFIRNLADLLVHLAIAPESAEVIHAADTPHLTTRELVRHLANAGKAPDRVLPLPVKFVRPLLRLLGREQDLRRLTCDLIVEPSVGDDTWHWAPPFPNHEGFRYTVLPPS